MSSITLSMIVKDEEKLLLGCLDSVKGIADEIVIVDTGSTDNTVKLAESRGAKVYKFEWVNDFSAARNYALSKSKGDWILYLDADERLTAESVEEIKNIIQGNEKLGVKCNVLSRGSEGRNPSIMEYIRFFRNSPGLYFKGKVHEQIEESLLLNSYSIVSSNIEILHLGYDLNTETLRKKAERNLALLREQFKLNKKDAYTAFQIGQSLIMLNRREEAHEYFLISIRDPEFEIHHRAQAFRFLAAIHMELNDILNAKEFAENGLALYEYSPVLNLVMSNIYIKLGEYEEAAGYCRKAYTYNLELAEGRRKSYFDIILNEAEIYQHSLNSAILCKNKDLLDFFLLQKSAHELSSKQLEHIHFFRKLIMNSEIDRRFIDGFVPLEYNPVVILRCLEDYGYKDARLKIMNKIRDAFTDNPLVKKKLASLYIEDGFVSESKELLEDVLQATGDPETVLQLLSLKLAESNPEELLDFISRHENHIKRYPQIAGKIRAIKIKLEEAVK